MNENQKGKEKGNAFDLRKKALDLLMSYELEGRYVNLLLSSPSLKTLSREKSAQLTALLYTSVENKLKYDYFIASLSKRSIDKIDLRVKNILRLGLCQILDMSSIPDYAAVNETVKLTANPQERSFVNGVLRAAVRSKDNMPYPPKEKNLLRYLSIKYSMPLPLVKHFCGVYGEEAVEELLKALSEEKNLSLTVNTEKIVREDLMAKLSEYEPKSSRYSKNGIILGKKIAPARLNGFDDGEFFVQDEASRIAVELLRAERGMTVVDVCSAPGGKAFFAAIKVGTTGRVYSFDIHESKLSLIEGGAKRLGLDNITVSCRDATVPCEELFGTADRVICDVPCSGLGVLSKKPDLRYKDVSALEELPSLQYTILEKSAGYLKAGGYMIYSTCTLNPSENEEITDKFIKAHSEFAYEPIFFGDLSSENGKLTLLPNIHGTDGFYIALIKRMDKQNDRKD